MKVVVCVEVGLKEGVLDPQGETIRRALSDLGFDSVSRVSSGKTFKLQIEAANEEAALDTARTAASKLLANPVIETYELEVVK